MSVEVVTRTIQFILAPVVMVSTCAIVLSALLSRYAFLNDRLRTLSQERRMVLRESSSVAETVSGSAVSTPELHLRIQEIDAQLPNLVRRHALLRRSVLALNYATMVFFLDMFVIAIAVLGTATGWIAGLALLVFLAGIAITAFAVLLSTLEVRTSQLAIRQDLAGFLEYSPTE